MVWSRLYDYLRLVDCLDVVEGERWDPFEYSFHASRCAVARCWLCSVYTNFLRALLLELSSYYGRL